jgi:hypothetical protein
MKTTNWSTIKSFAQSRKLPVQYLEYDHSYEVFVVDGALILNTIINKQIENDEKADFEANFKVNANKPILPRDNNGREITSLSPFTDASGFRFRGSSFSGSCSANSTADIDFQITQERYINGGRLLVNNIGNDDKMTFQVVDKDNILGYGANAVLDEFIKDYFIPTTGNLEVRLDYPARIIAGLYLRLKYTSTHASGCSIKCNLYLHWKAT